MSYKPIYKPFSARKHTQDKEDGADLLTILRYNFSIFTWILLGASAQALLGYLFVQQRYVLLISTTLLLARFGKTLLQGSGILPNPYMEGVIKGRTTALLPDEKTGEIHTAASKKIAILHLGAKSNHAYGIFAPQFAKVGDWLSKMNEELDAGTVKGFLGTTVYWRNDAKGAPEVNYISYWESIEDLWAFAHSGSHREAWQWWEKTIKDSDYVGINHEIFEADAQHWENVYINFQPTGMGATTHIVRGGKTIEGGIVDDKWVSPLVDANRGTLAKSSGRMGRNITAYDSNRVEGERYA